MPAAPDLDLARRFLAAHGPADPVLLCGITGSHIYGFPSPDSDIDMKGLHVAPTAALLGLAPPNPTHDRLMVFEGTECDLTTHEVASALTRLVKGDGNVLERILSPLQLVAGPDLDALQALARASIHQGFAKHYRGYLRGMQREHDLKGRAKTALYSLRVALTGVHLLRTGALETDVGVNATEHGPADLRALVEELVSLKGSTHERVTLSESLDAAVRSQWSRLEERLDRALRTTDLPEVCPNQGALEAWLLELRRQSWS